MGNKKTVRVRLFTNVEKIQAVGAFLARHKNHHIIFGGELLDLFRAVHHTMANGVFVMEKMLIPSGLVAL